MLAQSWYLFCLRGSGTSTNTNRIGTGSSTSAQTEGRKGVQGLQELWLTHDAGNGTRASTTYRTCNTRATQSTPPSEHWQALCNCQHYLY